MNLQVAESLANLLIAKHLPDSKWSFKWDNRINALGTCHYSGHTIQLSKRWASSLDKDEVRDTILHEIAHAIAGHLAGHGYHWKRACIAIGALPERLAKTDIRRTDIAITTHKLVHRDTGEVFKEYYRSPTQSTFVRLKHLYITGRKQETLGKLKIVETSLLDLLDL